MEAEENYDLVQNSRRATSNEWTKMIKSRLHPKSQNNVKFELTNFIKVFFDFAYYTCIAPFRLILDESGHTFVLKTWMPQQFLCAFLHVAYFIQMIASVRNSVPLDGSKFRQNPVPYFDIASTISSLMYKTITIRRFWMHKSEYLSILNTIIREKNMPIPKRKILGRCQFIVLYCVPTTQALVSFVIGTPFVSPIWTWSPSWWYRRLVAYTRYAFWYGDRLQENLAPAITEITVVDHILSVITALGLLERHFLSFYCDLSILACALTLWIASNSFGHGIITEIKQEESHAEGIESEVANSHFIPSSGGKRRDALRWEIIYGRFQAIRTVSSSINRALGSQITWLLAENILHYSINLNAVLLTDDIYYRIHLIMFYTITSTLFIVSADICNQLEAIKLWLMRNDNIQTVPYHDANLVLHELLAKEIGIRGSNIFTITYSLVATSLSLVITFFIICIQYSGI